MGSSSPNKTENKLNIWNHYLGQYILGTSPMVTTKISSTSANGVEDLYILYPTYVHILILYKAPPAHKVRK